MPAILPAKTYRALNPEQLARLFEMRADIAKARSEAKNHLSVGYMAECAAFREAAYIVRNIEFVGWTHDSRIVEEIPVASAPSEEGA